MEILFSYYYFFFIFNIFKVFVSAEYATEDKIRFEKNIYILRKQASIQLAKQEIECYIVSLDTSIIVYKVKFLELN